MNIPSSFDFSTPLLLPQIQNENDVKLSQADMKAFEGLGGGEQTVF